MLGGGRLVAAAGFGASEFEGLLAADRDIVEGTVFFAGAIVLVFPASFRASDAVIRDLVAVRLVLGTAEVDDVVVAVTVLPVDEVAPGRGAELPVALFVLGAAVVLAVAEVLGLAAGAAAGLGAGAVVLGLVAALVAAVAGLLLRLVAVLAAGPVFCPLAVVVVVVVDLFVPAVVALGWALEVVMAVEEPTGFLLGPEDPMVVVGFFLSAAAVLDGMDFLVGALDAVFVRPLATRLWVALGRVPGPVVAGPAAILPLTGPLDLLLASVLPEASLAVVGATCSFWGSSGCGGDVIVPF